MFCPRCVVELLDERHSHGIEVDVCPKCGGVWLDRGELERLNAQAQSDDPTLLATSRHTAPQDAGSSPRRPDEPERPTESERPSSTKKSKKPKTDDRDQDRDRDRDRDDDRERSKKKKKKKSKKKRLSDLLEDVLDDVLDL